MWKTTRRWLQMLTRPAEPPRVYLDRRPPATDGVVIAVALGDRPAADALADLQLAGPTCAEGLRSVVRFCARRSLPVVAWRISGIWHMPGRVGEVARWLRLLAQDAGTARLWVDIARMPPRFRRRLEAHLRRLGCALDAGSCVAES